MEWPRKSELQGGQSIKGKNQQKKKKTKDFLRRNVGLPVTKKFETYLERNGRWKVNHTTANTASYPLREGKLWWLERISRGGRARNVEKTLNGSQA